ncbi:MAG: CPBP family intramembrane glutamic endopeptidase [Promethearchaeota archaeon]
MSENLLKKYELTIYYILSFVGMGVGALISFLFRIELFGVNNINVISLILWVIMAFSPTYSAILLTGINHGKDGLKKLLSGYFKLRVSWKWWLGALALLLVPFLVCLIIALASGGYLLPVEFTVPLLLISIIYYFFSGPIAEEAGWRGFALPRMLEKHSATSVTLLQGVIWIFWHVPLVIVPGSSQATAFWPVYATLVLLSNIFLNWLYINSKGSLAVTILAHFSFNFSSVVIVTLLALVPYMTFSIVGSVLGVAYLLIIYVFFSSKTYEPRSKQNKE